MSPLQLDSSVDPSISRTRSSSFPKQCTVALEPLSSHNNFKSTVRPGGMEIIQVQTEAGRVSLDWSVVELSVMVVVLLLENGPDTVRLM